MSARTKAKAVGELVKGDSIARWRAAQLIAQRWSPDVISAMGEHSKAWLRSADFAALAEGSGAPKKQWERLFTVAQFAMASQRLGASFVECGTYRGASALMLAAHCPANLYLFDSWQGLSEPEDTDGDYWLAGALDSDMDEAVARLDGFDRAVFLPGWIPERFEEVNEPVGLIHIDVDLYAPTRDSVGYFWDLLLPGGVVICDDYGFTTCPGARRAIDEFFEEVRPIIELPTGQCVVIK